MFNNDDKYKILKKKLRALPRIKARSGFEGRLFQRIRNTEEGLSSSVAKLTGKGKDKGWLFNIFKPSFAPALGLTLILIIGTVLYLNYLAEKEQTKITETQTTTEPPPSKEPKIESPITKSETIVEDRIERKVTEDESFERSLEKKGYSDFEVKPSETQPLKDFGKNADEVMPKFKLETIETKEMEKSEDRKKDVIMKKSEKKESPYNYTPKEKGIDTEREGELNKQEESPYQYNQAPEHPLGKEQTRADSMDKSGVDDQRVARKGNRDTSDVPTNKTYEDSLK